MKRFQIISGGKGKHKDVRTAEPKLFRAASISNLTKGDSVYYDVRFNWYCLERTDEPFAYESLIARYPRLDEKQRQVMEREVSRYFTGEEIKALESYLMERYGIGLAVEEVPLPIEERTYLFGEGSNVIYEFLELSEKPGYSLPFKVWGFYVLEHCLTSPSLEYGARFLMRALELLDFPSKVSRARLESVVKALFDEDGLVVESRKETE